MTKKLKNICLNFFDFIATRQLYIKEEKSLLFPANTRWSLLSITFSRLLDIINEVNEIASNHKFGSKLFKFVVRVWIRF